MNILDGLRLMRNCIILIDFLIILLHISSWFFIFIFVLHHVEKLQQIVDSFIFFFILIFQAFYFHLFFHIWCWIGIFLFHTIIIFHNKSFFAITLSISQEHIQFTGARNTRLTSICIFVSKTSSWTVCKALIMPFIRI